MSARPPPGTDTGAEAPPPEALGASPVFLAKLRPPPATHLVRRERLITLLDDALRAPLVVVAAPAGSGKTSLLSSWAAETDRALAWLSLDESDRNPARLLLGVLAAIDAAVPGGTSRARSVLTQRGPLEEALAALLFDLEQAPAADVVLVLDDLNDVDDVPEVVHLLADLATYTPDWFRLVLVGRRRPRLNLERLRAQGRLREVSFEELQFSPQETAEMLRRLAPGLADEDIARTSRRAAGWAATIQLAGLAARVAQARQGRAEPDGADRLTDDYLWQEALAGEPPELIEMLDAATLFERVNGDLVAAVSGHDDAAELLERAADRGLFLTRLAQPGWYALHSLVRELLRADLAERRPDVSSQMHRRAARWYADAGEVALSVKHWLAAGRPREALRAVSENNGALYDAGRESVVVEALSHLPPQVVGSDTAAAIDYAWANMVVDRRALIDATDLIDARVGAMDLDGRTTGHLQSLRSARALQRGDWSGIEAPARAALAQFGPSWNEDFLGRFGWNLLARDVALGERWVDDGPTVREISQNLWIDGQRRLAYEGTRCLGLALAGRPRAAMSAVQEVTGQADVANMSLLSLELALAAAVSLRELGQADRARAELEVLVHRSMTPLPYVPFRAHLELAECAAVVGRPDEAEHHLAGARAMMADDFSGQGPSDWADATETLVALGSGRLQQAWAAASRISDPAWGPLCRARVHLGQQDRPAASVALAAVRPRSVRHEVVLGLLRARAASTRADAADAIRRAAGLAAGHGLVQTVAGECGRDGAVLELLERAADAVPATWLGEVRHCSVPQSFGRGALPPGVRALTPRERDVLRMLPSRLTVSEIAQELHLSTNTVKFHLKVIYRKLDCSSRSEAAAVARGLTRIPRG